MVDQAVTFERGDRVRLVYDIGLNWTTKTPAVPVGETGTVSNIYNVRAELFPITVEFDHNGLWPVRPEEIEKEESNDYRGKDQAPRGADAHE